jgi:hypothetical protein
MVLFPRYTIREVAYESGGNRVVLSFGTIFDGHTPFLVIVIAQNDSHFLDHLHSWSMSLLEFYYA